MPLFFGYGANRNRGKLTQIIGHDPKLGLGAVAEGFNLCYQNLDQIPERAQEVIRDVYGEEYKTYTLRSGKGMVSGVVYDLKDEDLDKIKEWEFVGIWREMVEVKVTTANGHTLTALTEKAFDAAEIAQVVDGLLYDEFVQPQKEKFDEQAADFYSEQQIKQIKDWLEKQR